MASFCFFCVKKKKNLLWSRVSSESPNDNERVATPSPWPDDDNNAKWNRYARNHFKSSASVLNHTARSCCCILKHRLWRFYVVFQSFFALEINILKCVNRSCAFTAADLEFIRSRWGNADCDVEEDKAWSVLASVVCSVFLRFFFFICLFLWYFWEATKAINRLQNQQEVGLCVAPDRLNSEPASFSRCPPGATASGSSICSLTEKYNFFTQNKRREEWEGNNTLNPKDFSVSPHSSELLTAHCLKLCMKVWCFFSLFSSLLPHPLLFPPKNEFPHSCRPSFLMTRLQNRRTYLQRMKKGNFEKLTLELFNSLRAARCLEVKVRQPTLFCRRWLSLCNLELLQRH